MNFMPWVREGCKKPTARNRCRGYTLPAGPTTCFYLIESEPRRTQILPAGCGSVVRDLESAVNTHKSLSHKLGLEHAAHIGRVYVRLLVVAVFRKPVQQVED